MKELEQAARTARVDAVCNKGSTEQELIGTALRSDGRQRHAEPAALTGLRLDGDAAAEAAHERAGRSPARAPCPGSPSEDARAGTRRRCAPGRPARSRCRCRRRRCAMRPRGARPRCGPVAARLRRELQGVGQQVLQDQLEVVLRRQSRSLTGQLDRDVGLGLDRPPRRGRCGTRSTAPLRLTGSTSGRSSPDARVLEQVWRRGAACASVIERCAPRTRDLRRSSSSRSSSSAKPEIVRSGSVRSWAATEAKRSSSSLDAAKHAPRGLPACAPSGRG